MHIDGYQRGLASMVYKLFDDKSAAVCADKYAAVATHTRTEINFNFENQN